MTKMRPFSTRRLLVACVLWSFSLEGYSQEPRARDFFELPVQIAVANAAARGQTSELDRLLAEGADINSTGREGMTALYWALLHRSKPGVSWLLSNHSDPNVVYERDGTSATSIAAMLEDPWFLGEVLEHGGNPNIRNPKNGRAPLFEAIASGRKDNARRLISAGADMNVLDALGETPLVMAGVSQKWDLVYDMLVAGADPTIKTSWRGAAIVYVIKHGPNLPTSPEYEWKLKVIERLKQSGLDVENGR
jgi:uncharacterized protein